MCLLFLATALHGQSRDALLKGLAGSTGWKPAGVAADYDETTIDTIAGPRAAAIKRYGLIGATVQDWAGPDGTVRLTLYEMNDATAAYGLFTLERTADQSNTGSVPLGSESFRTGNRSYFWQSKYVVRLDGNTPSTVSLGPIVSENIFGRSRKPPVSAMLPPKGLVEGSDRYVLHAEGIDRSLQLDTSTLGFDDSVEIATAAYRINSKPARLVLLLYPTQHLAKKYADQWDLSDPDNAAFRKRRGALIALVRGTRDVGVAEEILAPVNYETQVTWNEPLPDISLSTVILTIFSFIGIALLFTVVAGISFGGLRVFVKARYPNRVFDRAQDMEIIQLKLEQGLTRKEIEQ